MKKYKQNKAIQSELDFFNICKQRKIKCKKLDDINNEIRRKKFLINTKGKCPDFLCEINKKSIFVEIKTQCHFPNARREKFDREIIKASRKAGNFIHSTGSFNYEKEIKGVLIGILKDTSNKFKNIKEEYKYPRIMFLEGVFGVEKIAYSVFLGNKKEGLFYKTGSNVSAVVFKNTETKSFDYITNPEALNKIYLSKNSFDLFFKNVI